MAKGRTVSAIKLTKKDEEALLICHNISEAVRDNILKEKPKKEFWEMFGRVHLSRDAGLGRGGGKIQRDALCTRGRTDKAPFSNRNLRWHPLIVANETPPYAKEVDKIVIKNKTLIFVIRGVKYTPENVYKLPEVYCAPLNKWADLIDELKTWEDDDWTKNSCIIPAAEYSTINYSVESFAISGMIIASGFYDVDIVFIYKKILPLIKKRFKNIGFSISKEFPKKEGIKQILKCPLCLAPVNKPPAEINFKERHLIWQPPWRKSKREEGKAESLQLLHVKPLNEQEIRHTPKYARYGHRWCNVAMTDQSVEKTLDFMRAIVNAHAKGKVS